MQNFCTNVDHQCEIREKEIESKRDFQRPNAFEIF